MAKKPTPQKAKPTHVFTIGDMVEVLHLGPGKIVELRGPLGPNGAEVYRVMYRTWPRPGYLEVWADQIRPLTVSKSPKRVKGESTPPPETTKTAGG